MSFWLFFANNFIKECAQSWLKQHYVFSRESGLRAEKFRFGIPTGQGFFLLSDVSRSFLGSTQPPVQWTTAFFLGVKRRGHEVDHSAPSPSDVKSEWSVRFGWPCIIVYQYSETNVMHFVFSLLRIKGLCMFRALLAYPQEALHKRHLVYCLRVMSVGCCLDRSGTGVSDLYCYFPYMSSWCWQRLI
jgi:hypothetical protein